MIFPDFDILYTQRVISVMKVSLITVLLFTAVFTYAQQKYALVIGNGDYTGISKLTNPVNDANDMAASLRDLGFSVEIVLNGTIDQMEKAAMNLIHYLGSTRNSYGFFYYAGHGIQSGGDNYLIPTEASSIQTENHLRQRAFSVQTLLDNLNDSGNELNMVVLDACRDNPFGWARSGSRGLTIVNRSPTGSIIMYATSANSTAEDGTGHNGLFTSQLLNNIRTPGLSVRDIFDRTGQDVLRISNGKQHPELSIKYFNASSVYLDSQSAEPSVTVQPIQESAPLSIPADFYGKWVSGNTIINFSTDTWSVSSPLPDGSPGSYTVSLLTCTPITNNTNQNQNYQHGYRLTGKVIESSVPNLAVNDMVDRSYLFNSQRSSFWNSQSSTYVIYNKQ